jgi:hypothetical protein
MPETEEVPTEYGVQATDCDCDCGGERILHESGWVLMYVCILYVSMVYLSMCYIYYV